MNSFFHTTNHYETSLQTYFIHSWKPIVKHVRGNDRTFTNQIAIQQCYGAFNDAFVWVVSLDKTAAGDSEKSTLYPTFRQHVKILDNGSYVIEEAHFQEWKRVYDKTDGNQLYKQVPTDIKPPCPLKTKIQHSARPAKGEGKECTYNILLGHGKVNGFTDIFKLATRQCNFRGFSFANSCYVFRLHLLEKNIGPDGKPEKNEQKLKKNVMLHDIEVWPVAWDGLHNGDKKDQFKIDQFATVFQNWQYHRVSSGGGVLG